MVLVRVMCFVAFNHILSFERNILLHVHNVEHWIMGPLLSRRMASWWAMRVADDTQSSRHFVCRLGVAVEFVWIEWDKGIVDSGDG